jgi:hypothetical protein
MLTFRIESVLDFSAEKLYEWTITSAPSVLWDLQFLF